MSATISRDDLKAKIDHKDDFTLVEALPEELFHDAHLPGAINLPQSQVKAMARKVLRDKNADIVVYCASETCDAAPKSATTLMKMGYSHVRHYQGGKKDWINAGLPVEAGDPHTVA